MSNRAWSVTVAHLLCAAFVALDAPAECTPYWSSDHTAQTAVVATAFAAGDFNADGRADIAAMSPASISVALTSAAGEPGAPILVTAGSGRFESIAAVDVTGDTKLDLLVNDTTLNTLVVLPGHGDGTFGAAVSTSTTITPNELATGDFTGDGKTDVVFVSSAGAILTVWAGNNTGAFHEAGRVLTSGVLMRFAAGDFDADGKLDLFGQVASIAKVRLYRGNGNGTFAVPVEYPGGHESTGVVAADLDDDGDLDVAMTSAIVFPSVLVFLNTGGTFAPYTRYWSRSGWQYTDPVGLSAGDVTGDGSLDLVAAIQSSSHILTFVGNGDGTFAAASYTRPFSDPVFTYIAELTGDDLNDLIVGGNPDVLASTEGAIATIQNTCGGVRLYLQSMTPVISVGTPGTIKADVGAMGEAAPDGTPDYPTGTLTALIGTTSFGTALVGEDASEFTFNGLAAGTYEILLDYSGDDHYDAATLGPVTMRVTTETTTATLSTAETTVELGSNVIFTFEVTASGGGQPAGPMTLFRDGVVHSQTSDYFSIYEFQAGTHSYQVRFDGSTTHPPSPLSAPITMTFTKRSSYIYGEEHVVLRAGETRTFRYRVSSTGSVTLRDGTTLVATKESDDGGVDFPLTLSEGVHHLTARYSGNDEYLPAETTTTAVAMRDGVLALDVYAGNQSVSVSWLSSVTAARVELSRAIGSAWSIVDTRYWTTLFTYSVPAPAAGSVYIYRAQAYDSAGNLIATSNVDAALLTTFTNDPLIPGLTKVTATHVTQLVTAINAYRAAFGLGAIAPIANAAPGKLIKAQDLLALRYAIIDLRALTGAPDLDFGTITAKTTPIRARDIQQLRDSLR